jgi:L-alanine-DL-glutamate epimerase-like enolase superfamily enzyme
VISVELESVSYRFRRPVVTAYGTLEQREVLRLRLVRDGDTVGLGEAAPLPAYDGVSLDAVRAALSPALPGLPENRDAWPTIALPQAAAALDMARLDAHARERGTPVAALGLADHGESVAVNATIPDTDPGAAAHAAAAAAAAGFGCVKLKVGVDDDAGRVAAVRAAVGPDVAIRLDANGAWDVEEAVSALQALAPAGVELCEEPVHGVRGLARVRERLDGAVAIAMDETARDPEALTSGACDYACLKVADAGGISALWDAADAARSAGTGIYVASTYDGPVGIAAGLHAAAALGEMPHCGLATLSLFSGVDDPFPARAGRMTVPAGPGLGIS